MEPEANIDEKMSLGDSLPVAFPYHRENMKGSQQVPILFSLSTQWKLPLCYFKEKKKYYVVTELTD